MKTKKRPGFTLVELLIVICVISILFVVLISRVDFTTDKTRITGVQSDFRAFQTAAHQVAVEDGELIDDLNLLAERLNANLDTELQIYVENNTLKTDAVDPWGTPYEIKFSHPVNTKGQTVFVSAGPDLTFNTPDDIGTVVICELYNNNTNIVIKDYEQEEIHICSFVIASTEERFKASDGNCTTNATYYYSCSCGLTDTRTFNGDKNMSVHINDVKYEYEQLNDNQHTTTAICKGCNVSFTTTNENHNFVNDICDKCGYERHVHVYNKEVVADRYIKNHASCNTPTNYYKSCSCGESGTEETFYSGDALGHSYVHVTTQQSTCTQEGLKVSQCERCNDQKTETLSIAPHNYNQKIISKTYEAIKATCTIPASYYYTCICKKVSTTQTFVDENGPVDLTNHVGETETVYEQYTNDEHSVITLCLSCNHSKQTVYARHNFNASNTCLQCDLHIHKFEEKNTSNKYLKDEATCITKATYFYKCVGCEDVGTNVFEAGYYADHQWINDECDDYVVIAPTCVAGGTYYQSCSVCNAKATTIFTGTNIDSNNHGTLNSFYNYLNEEEHERGKKCSLCKDIVMPAIPENHEFDDSHTCIHCEQHVHEYTSKTITNYYKDTDATCSKSAVYYYKCVGCEAKGTDKYSYGEPLIHVWANIVDNNYIKSVSTCKTNAIYYQSCSLCSTQGTTTFEVDQLNPNNHISDLIVFGGTENIHTKYSCCNAVVSNEHQYNQNVVDEKYFANIEATCITQKTYYKSCECGYSNKSATFTNGGLDVNNHSGQEIVDNAVAATCTTTGLTEGSHCSACQQPIKHQTVIAATGHTEIVDNAVAATCTAAGKTEGMHCSVCNKVLIEPTIIAATGHTEVNGGTAGAHKKCSVCNTITDTKHTYTSSIIIESTCTIKGTTKYECVCGYQYQNQNISLKSHVYDQQVIHDDYFASEANCLHGVAYYYSCICGKKGSSTFYDGDAVGKHVETWGKTASIHIKCSVCGTTLSSEHNYIEVTMYSESTCKTKGYNKYTCECGYSKRVQERPLIDCVWDENGICPVCGMDKFAGLYTMDGEMVYHWKELINMNVLKSSEVVDPTDENIALLNGHIVLPIRMTSIPSSAFEDCINLKKVTIGINTTTVGTFAFRDCTSLASIDGGESLKTLGMYSFSSTAITSFVAPESLTKIDSSAFKNSKLVNVTLNNNLTSLGGSAFEGTNIVEITIPGSVKSVASYLFYECKSLKTVHLEEGITTINDYAFGKCNKLHTVDFPSTLTTVNSCFYDNFNLTKINIVSIDDWCEIKFVEDNFNYANPLRYGHTNDHSDLYIDGKMISGKIVLKEGITNIPRFTFRETSVTEIVLPSTLKTMEWGVFLDTYIPSITVNSTISFTSDVFGPEGTLGILKVNANNISINAFEDANSINQIVFTNNVVSISAISITASKISSIVFESLTPPTMNENALPIGVAIYVPAESLELYKETYVNYVDYIVAK